MKLVKVFYLLGKRLMLTIQTSYLFLLSTLINIYDIDIGLVSLHLCFSSFFNYPLRYLYRYVFCANDMNVVRNDMTNGPKLIKIVNDINLGINSNTSDIHIGTNFTVHHLLQGSLKTV